MNSTYGKFYFKKHDRVLITRAIGQLDLDSIMATTEEVVPLIKAMNGPWASLMDYTQWELHTEEMIVPLIRFQKWLLKHNHEVEVAVVANSSLKRNARQKLLGLLDVKPDQVYVKTEDEAWEWLIKHKYCVSRPIE